MDISASFLKRDNYFLTPAQPPRLRFRSDRFGFRAKVVKLFTTS